jgi:hypothetical protein
LTAPIRKPLPITDTFHEALFKTFIQLGVAGLSISMFYTVLLVEILGGRTLGTDLVLGATCLLTAVLAMNGLAKLELILHPINENVLAPFEARRGVRHLARPTRRLLRLIHEIADEDALAGIAVAILTAVPLLWYRGEFMTFSAFQWHHLAAMAATLLGIMSTANLVCQHLTPILGLVEGACSRLLGQRLGGFIGVRLALAMGALLSSLTGEPAAAVFKLAYFKERVKPGMRADAAVGFAMTIGSGGGLTFFAAPPILIIWSGYLALQLGWDLGTLLLYVGGGCVLYVLVSAHALADCLTEAPQKPLTFPGLNNLMGMLTLGLVVYPHVHYASHLPAWVMMMDVTLGVFATWVASRHSYSTHEEKFGSMWQPWILSVLLIMLDFIGLVGDPLIMNLAGIIPVTFPLPLTALLLFTLTAWVSHFADNALASRVFIMIPIGLLPIIGQSGADLLAIAVVTGSLFGSLLTVSANLPNFYIKGVLGVEPGDWFRSGLKYYWTGGAYVAWLLLCSFLLT